jgi:hypothetical protein
MLSSQTIAIVKSTAPILEWGITPTQVHLNFFGPRQEPQKTAACPAATHRAEESRNLAPGITV